MPHPYDSCPVASYKLHFTPNDVREVFAWNPLGEGNCFFDSVGVGVYGQNYKGAVALRKQVCHRAVSV
jgi:hypothetical protein